MAESTSDSTSVSTSTSDKTTSKAKVVKNTILTDVVNDPTFGDRIIFGKPENKLIPGQDKMKYWTIPISIRNPDGSVGDLVFQIGPCFSRGLRENFDPTDTNHTKPPTGHSMEIFLFDKDGPTEDQQKFYDNFEQQIVGKSAEFMASEEVKSMIKGKAKAWTKDTVMAGGFDPIYHPEPKDGKPSPCIIYPKTMERKEKVDPKTKKVTPGGIITPFYKMNTEGQETIKPEDLMGKFCNVIAGVKIESIYSGGSKAASLQIKLWEADVEIQEQKDRRLLRYAPSVKSAEVTEEEKDELDKAPPPDEVPVEPEETKVVEEPPAEEPPVEPPTEVPAEPEDDDKKKKKKSDKSKKGK